jgi:6-phosphogluconolactonase
VELAEKAAQLFFTIAQEAIEQRARFTVALSGGSTPRAVNHQIASRFATKLDWTRVFIFFGDERPVPPDHPESNYRMARESLLLRVPVPPANVHRMPAELPSDLAASEYESQLRDFFSQPEGFPVFDLIFLGMGDDGHTASLFPRTAALQESRRWVVKNRVEKLNTDRITLTFPVINRARHVIFLVAGGAKAFALKQVLEGAPDPALYPSQSVHPEGRLTWLVDRTAAAELTKGP